MDMIDLNTFLHSNGKHFAKVIKPFSYKRHGDLMYDYKRKFFGESLFVGAVLWL